jgi:hypothetical protein
MTRQTADFGSLEELAALLEAIGLRLHAKNRIAGGESGYVWHLAETIRNVGHLAARAGNEPELLALFGDGYSQGDIPREAQLEHFLSLVRDEAISRTSAIRS